VLREHADDAPAIGAAHREEQVKAVRATSRRSARPAPSAHLLGIGDEERMLVRGTGKSDA
jgi:hypothetical protein